MTPKLVETDRWTHKQTDIWTKKKRGMDGNFKIKRSSTQTMTNNRINISKHTRTLPHRARIETHVHTGTHARVQSFMNADRQTFTQDVPR